MRKITWCFMLLSVGSLAASSAQATILAYYPLGEAGSVGASNLPIDTVNGNNFINPIGSATVVPPGVGGAPGSTEALDFTPSQGYYYTASDFMPADNFRIEIWAKPATDHIANLFSLGEDPGAITIGITTPSAGVSNWFAGANNVNWIGAAGGAGQTATLGVWTKLAVESVNGVMTFYINDVAQAGSLAYSNPLANGGSTIHLGVTPLGSSYFNGDLDELRISVVPEPSGMWLLGTGIVALFRLSARRKQLLLTGVRS